MPLSPDEIEVTPFALDDEQLLPLAIARDWLADEELGRADRFRFQPLRERFVRGRAMMRWILARHLDAEPGDLRFETGEHGKPRLLGEPLHFNLSHSENRAVLAVSRLPSIGIDIERFDRKVNVDALGRRCFRESEWAPFASLDGDARKRAFFWMWTAKEARMKATGDGFRLEPLKIEIRFAGSLPDACLEPVDPPAYLAPAELPGAEAACTVAALSPFRVSLGHVNAESGIGAAPR
ncbi:MAG: 4'-phosphopantetheinyl transferase superfamily protein [Verrucomicrobiales bacterium]